ncbi:hypothetical protein [Amycolatopsis sp. H20-H5]|uniref:hypothetical protein n=1 Tax=Amycolatopsis sp. H20-H5 TaxID=3046309 RepID=UPI002DBE01E6|nr:hypothetical protein [Amycolatopsis sp. H20-H5]MEC3980055.1 hypothetical protein [Amycolatopsis sp. H20-H5]
MEGRAYLEKLIADSLRTDRGQGLNLYELSGIAIGLVAAGKLDQAEADQLVADLKATLVSTGRLHVRTVGASAAGEIVVGRAEGESRPDWRSAMENPPPPFLRKVIALDGREHRIADRTLTLVSLEVWSTFVLLRVAFPGPADRREQTRWRGWDDVGTQYRGGGGTSSGARGWIFEQVTLHPAPTDEARLLTLAVEQDEDQVRLPIRLR